MESKSIPIIIAGPILRKVSVKQVVLWLVTAEPCHFVPKFSMDEGFESLLDSQCHIQQVRLAPRCYVYLLVNDIEALLLDQLIYYDIEIHTAQGQVHHSLRTIVANLFYPQQRALSFFVPKNIKQLLFGSCRNIHHGSRDALITADQLLEKYLNDLEHRPAVMLHGGDQVYIDDVAGPTLRAIHHLLDLLDFMPQQLPDTQLETSQQVHHNDELFYDRPRVLPKVTFKSKRLQHRFLPFRRTMSVFSSVKAHNHLITLNEMFGLYLLTWSATGWDLVGEVIADMPSGLTPLQQATFTRELTAIRAFISGLDSAARVMAHIPNYMIFDDHDVTDDWNLTALWEDNVYSNPLSKRVISNALVAYWLFQGWGNAPEYFDSAWTKELQQVCDRDDPDAAQAIERRVLNFSQWHYCINTEPYIIVIDTRTHRWRSERSLNNPSGLMDWERLVELEQELTDKSAAIILSAAPIFGVKFIETIQRVFTFFGLALMVDAENWMAHRGSAKKLLQVLARVDTPDEIVVLSGDVHYSFCFKVRQRFENNDTLIWQLTSSGIKNEFPKPWLRLFDWFERFLYFAASPINIFTKRRRLQIKQQQLKTKRNRILWSSSNIGLVEFENNQLKHYRILLDQDQSKQFL